MHPLNLASPTAASPAASPAASLSRRLLLRVAGLALAAGALWTVAPPAHAATLLERRLTGWAQRKNEFAMV